MMSIRRMGEGTIAAMTGVLLATSVLALWAAKTCLTDGVLLLWITTAQVCLYLVWRGQRSPFVLVTDK